MAYKAKPIEEGRYAVKLEICHGDSSVKTQVLNQSVIKVGTLSSSGLRLDWDDQVSRMHAVIEVNSPQDISVIDLGSRHGTYLNGVRINKANVSPGDELRFGDTRVTVRPATQAPTDSQPSPAEPWNDPERMNFTECMEWAAENEAWLHFSGDVIYAWIEGGEKVKAVTFREAINLLRDYSSK